MQHRASNGSDIPLDGEDELSHRDELEKSIEKKRMEAEGDFESNIDFDVEHDTTTIEASEEEKQGTAFELDDDGRRDRELPVIALSMTAGNDILFPGCHQTLKLDDESHDDLLRYLNIKENVSEFEGCEIEFAYIPKNAWGDISDYGTIAIIEYYNVTDKQIICSGITRFHVTAISDDMKHAKIRIFQDDHIEEEEEIRNIERLEHDLISSMTDIVNLTLKINKGDDGVESNRTELALKETLKRMQLFYTQSNEGEDDEDGDGDDDVERHWMMNVSSDLRRELLSFIVVDMLSVSYMDRKNILQNVRTDERLQLALDSLQPFVKELAAKGAIVGALGNNSSFDDTSTDNK